jgi:predicted deacylase
VESSLLKVIYEQYRLSIPIYRIHGKMPGPRVLLTAGIHGGEYTGVQIAFDLIETLSKRKALMGVVEIIPLVNAQGAAGETRINPLDGRNINSLFGKPGAGISAAICEVILNQALQADIVVDMHTAAKARYVQHAVYTENHCLPLAISCGLPFAVRRSRGKEGYNGTLTGAVSSAGKIGLTVELGGGGVIFQEDVVNGLRSLELLLGAAGNLPLPREVPSSTKIYPEDTRILVKAPADSILFPNVHLGKYVKSGEQIGRLFRPDVLNLVPVAAPADGTVIYLRTHNRIANGETILQLLD